MGEFIKELIAELRRRVKPEYADRVGTESWERKRCADALEASNKAIDDYACALAYEQACHKQVKRHFSIALDALNALGVDSLSNKDRVALVAKALAEIGEGEGAKCP